MSSPPLPNPTTTATTGAATSTADFLKSVARQRPRKHLHPAIYQTFYNPPPTTTAATFPPPPQHSNSRSHHVAVASSGGGFFPKHQQPNSDQNLPVGVTPNSSSIHLQQTLMGGAAAAAKTKVVSQSSFGADNSSRTIRDKNGDDTFIVIRGRKVQVSEGTSLYAQCRSWLKNGFISENQPQHVDHVKSLPKPLPASMVESRTEDDPETEEETEDVEHLSAKELLQQHVKHAKKVRARLRRQRLQRIERYKERLALLLSPVTDPQQKADPTSCQTMQQ